MGQLLQEGDTAEAKIAGVQQFVTAVIADTVGLQISKASLKKLAETLGLQLPDLDGNAAVESEQTISTEVVRDTCNFILQQIQPRLNSFDDVVTATRKVLACAHSELEDYAAAADALIAIDPGSQTKNLGVKEKIEIFLQISQFYLEDEESTKADSYVQRAAMLIHDPAVENVRRRMMIIY